MSGYTPGPWDLGTEGNGSVGSVYCDDATGSRVAIVYGNGQEFSLIPRAVEEANARLIAAAPSLVECLASSEELLSFYEGSASPEFDGAEPTVRINGEDFAGLLANIRAAISRATGEGK